MKQETKSWFLLILLACIWGSSFILMKKGMFDDDNNIVFTDKQVASLRMFIAGLILLPFALKAVRKVKDWRIWLALFGSGVCGNFLPAFLFTYAQQGVSSGYAGMLNSFTPIFTLLIGYAFFKNKLTLIQLIGVMIGTIGIVLLSTSGGLESNTGNYLHILSIVLATFLYGISLNLIKYKLSSLKAVEITSLAFFTIFIPAILSTIYFNPLPIITGHPHGIQSFIFVCILAIVGTAFAVVIFSHIITISSTLFASSVTYLIPIVAVIIGFAFKEQINTWQILAMFIILIGVFTANYYPQLAERRRVSRNNKNN